MDLKAMIRRHEGTKQFPYMDSVGKITIGVGWNLSDNGLPPDIIEMLLNVGIAQAEQRLDQMYPAWTQLDEVRRAVLVDMAFNLGMRLAGFKTFFACLDKKDWAGAKKSMLASLWAKQVGKRAIELAEMMETGNDQ